MKKNTIMDSYSYRKDIRTDEQFAKDISCRTKKEVFLKNLFVTEMVHRGYEVFVYDLGVDNKGKVFKGKSSCSVDYRFKVNDSVYDLDIKNSFVKNKCTFKVYNLKQYIKANAGILLFYNTGNINYDTSNIVLEKTKWGVIKPDKIQKMLDDKDWYNEPKFGNKLCVQIFESEYKKYFRQQRLTFIYDD
jgi:hypothetical protein